MKINNFKADPATVNKSGLFKMKRIFENLGVYCSCAGGGLFIVSLLAGLFGFDAFFGAGIIAGCVALTASLAFFVLAE